MPTDRVLIEIETIANTAGIEKAQAGMLGFSGSAVALGATIGLVAMVSKDMIQIAEKHEAAVKGLEQAYKATNTPLDKYQAQIDGFINSNRPFIEDQSAVIDGFAKLTRSGIAQIEVQKDMNRALDLAALKHISLADAVQLIDAAEHGRMKGLIDLGITTAKYTDSQGNMVASSHNVAIAMAEIDQRTKDGRQSLTDDQKATDELGNHWQDFARGPGKQLQGAFTDAKDIANLFITMLGKQGFWDALDANVISIGKDIENWLTGPLQGALNAAQGLAGVVAQGNRRSNAPPAGSHQSGAIPVLTNITVNAANDPNAVARAVAAVARQIGHT